MSHAHLPPDLSDRIEGGLWGSLVGDALGVPVEFSERAERRRDPVRDLRGYGTWSQPPGTWSDDGALLLCTAEALLDGLDPELAGERFLLWQRRGHLSAHGEVFDIGGATRLALSRLAAGVPAEEAGGTGAGDNGNGALMRILPVALRFHTSPPVELAGYAGRLAAVTHAHPRSRLACAFLCLLAQRLLAGSPALAAWRETVVAFQEPLSAHPDEAVHFVRLMDPAFPQFREDAIVSGGYVIHTLEAALWCLLQGGTWAEIVLRAVNLGGDTDTTGCVAGGLAGVLQGRRSIPADWVGALPPHPGLEALIPRFVQACAGA